MPAREGFALKRALEDGSVLGVDIGWSEKRRTNAVCRLDWDAAIVSLKCHRASLPERAQTLKRTIDRKLLVAAFDGPLCSDLKLTGHYRLAEQLLTRRLQERIGKPGQASSPTGKLLNHHANLCARVVLRTGMLNDASHDHAIHRAALVEAFPSSFLGVLLDEPETISVDRSNRSDKYYASLAQSDGLNALLKHLLPGRMLIKSFGDIKNHDERAAIVCALTALCVAAGDYTVVGDAKDGWIVLPPATFIQPWAKAILSENAEGGGLECRAP